MARMRKNKKKLKELLQGENWRANLQQIVAEGKQNIGPLMSFLLLDANTKHRAAHALGGILAKIAEQDSESAKNTVRNFMWHMNEESGNIGWGIPEAFAETLAQSPILANTYASILMSYIIDLGHDDNYCDNDILRRSCYWAIGRFAQAEPLRAEKARPWLIKGLSDCDAQCRGMAAWALAQLPSNLMDKPALRMLINNNEQDICEVFEGDKIIYKSVKDLAADALSK